MFEARVEGDLTKEVLREEFFCVALGKRAGRRRGTGRDCGELAAVALAWTGVVAEQGGELDAASQLCGFLRPRGVMSLALSHTADGLQTRDLDTAL